MCPHTVGAFKAMGPQGLDYIINEVSGLPHVQPLAEAHLDICCQTDSSGHLMEVCLDICCQTDSAGHLKDCRGEHKGLLAVPLACGHAVKFVGQLD